MDTKDADAMKRELMSLMRVMANNDMFYGVIKCRWCGVWLDYNDDSEKRPAGLHAPECFAVRYLGAPSR